MNDVSEPGAEATTEPTTRQRAIEAEKARNARSLIARQGAHALHAKYDSRELTALVATPSWHASSTRSTRTASCPKPNDSVARNMRGRHT